MTQLESILREGLEAMRAQVIERSREAGQEASGSTYAAMQVTSEGTERGARGALLGPYHFTSLIHGRGPGAVPAQFPRILMEWAQYKGLSFDSPKALASFAYATANKIAREGSRLYTSGLYLDLIETPIEDFETWLGEQIALEIHNVVRNAINPRADRPGFTYFI